MAGTQNSPEIDTLRQRKNNGETLTPQEEQRLKEADAANAQPTDSGTNQTNK